MTDLEIEGLHFQWIETKAQISCAVITQLIHAFAFHKAGFLMMWLMYLVVILLFFLLEKSLILLQCTVIMVSNKYCQLHPEFYSFYFQFSSSREGSAKVYLFNCKGNKEASEYLHVISNVWTALQKDLLALIFKTLVQLMLLFTKYI